MEHSPEWVRPASSVWHCPLCNCAQADRLFGSRGSTGPRHDPLSIVRCRQCGLLSLRPRPPTCELAPLYGPEYEAFWGPVAEEPNRFRRWMRRRHYALRCRAVRRAQPTGGVLLDIGCGTGGFLHELCRDGSWQGLGIDISDNALAIARQQGVDVRRTTLCQASLAAASFHAITMWEVLEHVPDPRETLEEAHRLLVPGGSLLLTTPNGDSWQARLWNTHWAGWDVPRHLQVFSWATLRRLLERTGFEIVRKLALPMERFFGVESARRWLSARIRGPAQTFGRRAAELAGILAWPALRAMDHLPFASSIALEARARPNTSLSV
jgi:2-polyprenyl-3-methyl-5-hydroxy-6-metoxy-1,4-benzoquinol methylase